MTLPRAPRASSTSSHRMQAQCAHKLAAGASGSRWEPVSHFSTCASVWVSNHTQTRTSHRETAPQGHHHARTPRQNMYIYHTAALPPHTAPQPSATYSQSPAGLAAEQDRPKAREKLKFVDKTIKTITMLDVFRWDSSSHKHPLSSPQPSNSRRYCGISSCSTSTMPGTNSQSPLQLKSSKKARQTPDNESNRKQSIMIAPPNLLCRS